jgi:hypothetical protein
MDKSIFKPRKLNNLELWEYMQFEPCRVFHEYCVKLNVKIEDYSSFFHDCFSHSYLIADNEIAQKENVIKYRLFIINNCDNSGALQLFLKVKLSELILNLISKVPYDQEVFFHYNRAIEKLTKNVISFNSIDENVFNNLYRSIENYLFEHFTIDNQSEKSLLDWIKINVVSSKSQIIELPNTNLQFIGDQVDLAELLKGLILNGNIKGTQKELFEVISKVFNFKIDERESIKTLRKRKGVVSQTKLLEEMIDAINQRLID